MIGSVLSVPVLVLSPIGLAWISTRMRRILPNDKESILKRIHKGELERIKKFMPRDLTKDVLTTDAEFWDCVGGFSGLLREYENAVCCVQLCQVYVRESDMDKHDVEYISQRAFTIGFLMIGSIAEEFFRRLVRLFGREMPHMCARWIAQLYWEVATQTKMLTLEYDTGQLAL